MLCIQEGLELLGINSADNLYESDLNIIDITALCDNNIVFIDLFPHLQQYQDTIDKTLFISISDQSNHSFIDNINYWFLTPHFLDDLECKGTKIPWAFGFRQKLIDFYQNHNQIWF